MGSHNGFMQKGTNKPHVDEPLQKEISRALFELLESHIEEYTADESEVTVTESVVDVDLFSSKVKEEYIKLHADDVKSKDLSKRIFPKTKMSAKKRKTVESGKKDDTDSTSSEEEDLELLASIAVSAEDLGTSNRVKQSTTPCNDAS